MTICLGVLWFFRNNIKQKSARATSGTRTVLRSGKRSPEEKYVTELEDINSEKIIKTEDPTVVPKKFYVFLFFLSGIKKNNVPSCSCEILQI